MPVIYKKSDAKDSGLPHESNVNSDLDHRPFDLKSLHSIELMKMTKKLIANARYRVLLQKTTHF